VAEAFRSFFGLVVVFVFVVVFVAMMMMETPQ
jgi:hypothetical protein